MGVTIHGLFVALNQIRRQDGSFAVAVSVATGTDAYQIYFDDASLDELSIFKLGDEISIAARPYVTSRGRLGWANAKLV